MSTDWYPQDTNEHFAQRVSFAEAYRCGVLAGAEAEREACAKVCEAGVNSDKYLSLTECAAAIRARGNT